MNRVFKDYHRTVENKFYSFININVLCTSTFVWIRHGLFDSSSTELLWWLYLMSTTAFRTSHLCTRNAVIRFSNTSYYRTDTRVTCYVNRRTCKRHLPLTLRSRVGGRSSRVEYPVVSLYTCDCFALYRRSIQSFYRDRLRWKR